MQAYCHWMAQYYLETHRQQQHQEKFVALVSNAVDALVPLLNKEVSWCLVHTSLAQSTRISRMQVPQMPNLGGRLREVIASERSEHWRSKL